MKCSKCGADNPDYALYCGKCASELPRKPPAKTPGCPNCGKENPKGQKFCGNCGTKLAGATGMDEDTEKPFVEYRYLGKTQSLTREGWMIRVYACLLFEGVFALIIGAEGYLLGALAFFGFGVILILISYAFAKKYQRAGRPLGLFGEVTQNEEDILAEIERRAKLRREQQQKKT